VNTTVTPVFYHKINRKEFDGKVADLSEVIEKEAGVQIRQSGGLGSFSSVSLRGSSAEQVMVYLDGVLLNDGAGGGVDLSNISLADVQSFEIYRGMSPIQFDRASIGGVVNFQTIRATPGLKVTAAAGYGSFNTRKFTGFLNHRPEKWTGKWDYLISADSSSADNDFRFKNDNGTPENPDDDRWEKRHNAEVDQFNMLTRMGLDVCSDTRLDFINKFFSKNQGLPSWNNRAETETDFSTDQNISTLKWVADDVSPFHLNTCSRINYLFKTECYDDSKGHVGLGKQKNEYNTRRLSGTDCQARLLLNIKSTIIFGSLVWGQTAKPMRQKTCFPVKP
jgi:outer membrane cobalamin receptor